MTVKIGKLPEQVLVRSVLRQAGHRREEVLAGPAVGRDCAAMALGENEVFVLSTDPITGTAKDIGSHGIHITANDLAASGAEPVGVLITALLPEDIREEQIREIMQDAEEVCRELNMEILGGHTEVTRAVAQPLLSVTGVGKADRGELLTAGMIHPGQDLVVTKWIGLEATAILAKEKEQELLSRFSQDFVRAARSFGQYISVVADARIAKNFGVSAMHDITEGGIFGALWEMAEGSGVGLEADLKAIPIRQETVEICEYFGLNPYQIMSSGSLLIAAEDGPGLVRALAESNIRGTVIGRATAGPGRILRNGEDVRYLERPQPDELYKIMG
ncbi:MAG TPA: hydrogenase maturation factor [Lachnospiraceae bacterium]|nr:hydrogenase maturation factor [Lachnospiraceae bacterium]